MIHPLFHLIATRPQLLVDHAEAYGELAGEELAKLTARWRRRIALTAVALCCVGVAATLGGVALMLWAVTPSANLQFPWALLAVPSLPAAMALICLLVARGGDSPTGIDALREQLSADIAMLRSVTAVQP